MSAFHRLTLFPLLSHPTAMKFYVQATNPAGDSPKSEVVDLKLG